MLKKYLLYLLLITLIFIFACDKKQKIADFAGTYATDEGISCILELEEINIGRYKGHWSATYGAAHICEVDCKGLLNGKILELSADGKMFAKVVSTKIGVNIIFLDDMASLDCGVGHPTSIEMCRK